MFTTTWTAWGAAQRLPMTAREYHAVRIFARGEPAVGDGEQSCITLYFYDRKGRVVRETNPCWRKRRMPTGMTTWCTASGMTGAET